VGQLENGLCEGDALIGETGETEEGALVQMPIIGFDELLPLLEVFRFEITLSPRPRSQLNKCCILMLLHDYKPLQSALDEH
jgi:hypothetical protein